MLHFIYQVMKRLRQILSSVPLPQAGRRAWSLFKARMNQPQLTPFLALPFGTNVEIEITEGWFYSPQERQIHGHDIHYGVDFAGARGTPVLAAAEGWAVASYELNFAGNYQGKSVGFGLGNFIKVWHPHMGVYTLYGHLESVAPEVPFLAPVARENFYLPTALHHSPENLMRSSSFVARGQCLGYIGDSGLSWGYQERPGFRPDPVSFPSWDETHLHFEVYAPQVGGYKKKLRYDPYGIYADVTQYFLLEARPGALWLLDNSGNPQFASAETGTLPTP